MDGGMAANLTVYSEKLGTSRAEIQIRSLVVDQLGDGTLFWIGVAVGKRIIRHLARAIDGVDHEEKDPKKRSSFGERGDDLILGSLWGKQAEVLSM